jgi:hypothetical protein
MDLHAEIDRLYELPLDEFVRERDDTAKRLRREGERDAADRVKALRKPTAGAWALNQAVRRRRRERDELLVAGERLRSAHEALLSGGDPDALREAMREERRLASAVADCAEAIASETGKSGPALKERVRATLHAATVDDEARAELESGRFVREREAVGLGPFGAADLSSAPAPSRRRQRAGRPEPKAKAKRAAPKRDDDSAARERARRVADAERLLGEARAGLEEVQAEQADATDRLKSAREAVREAETAERAARKAARERAREVAKRERELERLQAKRS